MAAAVLDEKEAGIISYRDSAAQDGIVQSGICLGIVAGVEHIDSHGIILVVAGEIILHDAVLNRRGGIVKYRESRYDHVVGNLGLDERQTLFERYIPVECKSVGEHLHPVLLLLEAEYRRGGHKIEGDDHRIRDAARN